MVTAVELPAVNFTPCAQKRDIRLIVLHTAECEFIPGAARAVALYFANINGAPQASAHYVVDDAAIFRCVEENDVAWHAPGANHDGIGIEHAGRARFTPEQWASDYARRMLELSAELCADICNRHGVPAVFIRPSELLTGKHGITTHAVVSAAYGRSDHWDPGSDFPLEAYVSRVQQMVGNGRID